MVYISFFTERNGLNSYFLLQVIETGPISYMCNVFLFLNIFIFLIEDLEVLVSIPTGCNF